MSKTAKYKEPDIEELFSEMALMNFEIGSQFFAKPTYIVDPHDFYIIPFPFLFHLPTLSKPGKPLDLDNLKEDMVVVYASKNPDVNKYFKIELDENIRGVIQKIGDDKTCQIYALDRGFVENNVTLDRIYYPATTEVKTMPSLIQRCELDLCGPIGDHFSKECIEAFVFYIGNEKLSVVIRGKSVDKLKIVVYNSNPDDIATLLALTHYSYLTCTLKNDLDTIESCPKLKLAYKHLAVKKGDIIDVRVQSGSSLNQFYVTPMSSYKEYVQNRKDFTNFCKSLPEMDDKDFKKGTLVGVPDDAGYFYERAVILRIKEDNKAQVKLVDWGSELDLPRCRIKAIKTEFHLTSPAHAMFCRAVDGFVPWDNGLSNFLYKGYTFTIKIKKVGRGFKTPHIVALAPLPL